MGRFPRLAPWLEFSSEDDYWRYQETSRGPANWLLNSKDTLSSFARLLDKRPSESTVHKYLEEHPYLLPGVGRLHHGPYEGIVATKLPLGPDFITDFTYVDSNSQMICFTCVEIESPRKRLFRKDGKLHRDYLDARQQITDWLRWANQNPKESINCWGKLFNGRPPWYMTDVSFRGFLVFGRRSEIDTTVKQERWSAESASLNPALQTMTFDRLLQPNGAMSLGIDNRNLAVCSYRDRRFYVKKVIS